MTAAIPVPGGVLAGTAAWPAGPRLTDREAARLLALAADAVSPATSRAYRSDWQRWERWCAGRSAALPADPALVALYVQ